MVPSTKGDTFSCGLILLLVWLIASNVWIGIFLLSGVILGIAYAVVSRVWDDRFRTMSDFRKHPIGCVVVASYYFFIWWLIYYTITEMAVKPHENGERVRQIWYWTGGIHWGVFVAYFFLGLDDLDPEE